MRRRSLRRNFSWTFVSNTVYWGCQWAVVVLLAKLGSPEMVGRFSLGLAISTPVAYLCNLQLRAMQATDARREHPFGVYLALRLATTVGIVVIVALRWRRRDRGGPDDWDEWDDDELDGGEDVGPELRAP